MADGRSVSGAGRESASRFAQRARDERRHRRRRWLAVAALLAAAVGVAVTLSRSSLLRVQSVVVTGAGRQSTAEVLAAAAIPRRAPMWNLDQGAISGRVAALPWVRTVSVSRSWPRTVRVTVAERQAVAAVTGAGFGPLLVDHEAAEITKVTHAPVALLPIVLAVTPVPATAQSRRPLIEAALVVAAALPPPVRARLERIVVTSAQRISLRLRDGTLVEWGSSDRSERKAAVLSALLVTPHSLYDVSAPESPAVR